MLLESVLLVAGSRWATKPKPQPKLWNSFVSSGSLDEILMGFLINSPQCEGACGRRHLTHDVLSNRVSLNPSPPTHLPTYYRRSCRKLLCPTRDMITSFCISFRGWNSKLWIGLSRLVYWGTCGCCTVISLITLLASFPSILFCVYKRVSPVPVAAQSKALVCGRSPAEILGSNPTGSWMFVCCECV